MKTKLIVYLGMLCMLWNFPLDAQHKMVKLSNFDPAPYRFETNQITPNFSPWAYTNIWGDAIMDSSCGLMREYAFIGVACWNWLNSNKGISVVDVTDPLNPVEVAFLTCYDADQRDFVTYTDPGSGRTFLYAVGEGNHQGMYIFDLTDLPNSYTELSHNYTTGSYDVPNASHAHNIQLDEATGKLIVCGTHTFTGGGMFAMFMFDLNPDPENPLLIDALPVAADNTYYIHDVYFNNDKLYTASIDYDPDLNGPIPPYDTYAYIYNTSSGNFTMAGGVDPYPTNQSPAIPLDSLNHVIHDIYASANHQVMVTSDEHALGQAIFWDISNPASPVETDRYGGHTTGPNSWDTVAQHNHVIKGNDRCYVAHYSNGLWVLDISDPYDVKEISYYDTYLQHNYGNYSTYENQFFPRYGTGYFGAWGVFADLPSGNIMVCDMNNGLYVINDCVKPALQGGNNIVLGGASYSNMVYGKAAATNLTVDPAGGSYTVGTDGNVTLIAGSKITLKPGFHAQADGKFHAQIGSMCQNCPDCPLGPTEDSDKSKTDKVVPPAGIATLSCFPNPASSLLNIKITLPEPGITSLVIYDQVGRTVRTVSENVFSGSGVTQHTIDIAALPAGVYTIKLSAVSGVQTVRFSKLQ